jgi:glyoxylase-like metal-dependent hydrolase (beta-lactamase superfamily II)
MVCEESEKGSSSEFKPVTEGDIIEVGDLKFEVLETPGHSRGGLCFYERAEGVLFSGDTLFAGAIGRTDHPGGDYDLLMKSIFEKLMILEGTVAVIPGHGPETDIASERNTNPFLMPFNEPYED